MTLLSYLGQRNVEAHKHAHEFRRTFGRSLGQYWDPISGFDVVKFDDEIAKPPDGTSTRQQLKKVWGSRAVTLIERLIKI